MNLLALLLIVVGGGATIVGAAEQLLRKEEPVRVQVEPSAVSKAEQLANYEKIQAMKQQHALHPMVTFDEQYVGSYQVNSGTPYSSSPPTYTCREACAAVFGGSAEDYQGSTTSEYIDNFCYLSNYDSNFGPFSCKVEADTFKQCSNYGPFNSCESAWVGDWCFGINHCWKQFIETDAPSESPTEAPTKKEMLLFNLPLFSSISHSWFVWEGGKEQKYMFSSSASDESFKSLQIRGTGRGFESAGAWEGNLLVWVSFSFSHKVTGPQLSLFLRNNEDNGIVNRIVAQVVNNQLTLKFGDGYSSVTLQDVFQEDEVYTMALFHNRAYGQTDAMFYSGSNFFSKEFAEQMPMAKLSIPKVLQHPTKIGLSNAGSDKHSVQYSFFRAKLEE